MRRRPARMNSDETRLVYRKGFRTPSAPSPPRLRPESPGRQSSLTITRPGSGRYAQGLRALLDGVRQLEPAASLSASPQSGASPGAASPSWALRPAQASPPHPAPDRRP